MTLPPSPSIPTSLLDTCQRQPHVLISACLAGEPVRYDGQAKCLGPILGELSPWFTLVHHCPEVAANLGVPRPPVQLQQDAVGEVQACGVEDPGWVVDKPLQQAATDWLHSAPPITAAILKARSPSCGSQTTPVFDESGNRLRVGDGLFTAALKQQRGTVIVDESYFFKNKGGLKNSNCLDDKEGGIDKNSCHWFVIGCYLSHCQAPPQALATQLGWPREGSPDQRLQVFLEIKPQQRERRMKKAGINTTKAG